MRFMVLVKAVEISERGALPTEEMLATMIRFNEDLAKRGKLLAGEGLQPSARGARITFRREGSEVTAGPFAVDGLVAGFWIVAAESLEEAVELLKAAPMLGPPEYGDVAEIEIRPIMEAEDFGSSFSDEMRRREDSLRELIERQSVEKEVD
jgi:hypothetical protein